MLHIHMSPDMCIYICYIYICVYIYTHIHIYIYRESVYIYIYPCSNNYIYIGDNHTCPQIEVGKIHKIPSLGGWPLMTMATLPYRERWVFE